MLQNFGSPAHFPRNQDLNLVLKPRSGTQGEELNPAWDWGAGGWAARFMEGY